LLHGFAALTHCIKIMFCIGSGNLDRSPTTWSGSGDRKVPQGGRTWPRASRPSTRPVSRPQFIWRMEEQAALASKPHHGDSALLEDFATVRDLWHTGRCPQRAVHLVQEGLGQPEAVHSFDIGEETLGPSRIGHLPLSHHPRCPRRPVF
jgi:hypothetical protein